MEFAKQSMRSLWEGLCKLADQNQDKVVTIDEWVSILKTCKPPNEPVWFKDYLTYMFKLFDVSADSKLDLPEYTDGMNSYGFNADAAKRAFEKFSIDKSGKQIASIDWFQWRDRWYEYFYSPNANAAGNHLFGVLPL